MRKKEDRNKEKKVRGKKMREGFAWQEQVGRGGERERGDGTERGKGEAGGVGEGG